MSNPKKRSSFEQSLQRLKTYRTNPAKKALKLEDVSTLSFKEIIKIKDDKTKNDKLLHLFNSLGDDSKRNELIENVNQLSENLIHFNSDQVIINIITNLKNVSFDNDLEDRFFDLVCEFVNFKPYSCEKVLSPTIFEMFFGMKEYFESEELKQCELERFTKIHTMLQNIQIPSSKSILLNLLRKKFPYYQRTIHEYSCYLYNCLEVHRNYKLGDRIIGIIFDRLLWIDLRCPKEKLVSEEETIFTFEDCENETMKPECCHEVKLLDNALGILFNFIDRGAELNEIQEVFRDFTSVFERVLLKTRGCSYLQFVMFYLVSKSENIREQFVNLLWSKINDKQICSEIMQNCLCYLGSFFARCKLIEPEKVADFLSELSQWIHLYIERLSHQQNQSYADHSVFHTACQTLFYLFSFRCQQFDDHMLREIKTMNIQGIVTCKLNPLKYCLPTIMLRFSRLASLFQVAYCSTVIESNKRDSLNNIKPQALTSNDVYFFPFDPCLLPKISKRIEVYYLQYSGNDEEEDNEDMELAAEDESDGNLTPSCGNVASQKSLFNLMLSDSSPAQQSPLFNVAFS